MQREFDSIIVGGGLSGGLAALALAGAGLEVAVIDRVDPQSMRDESFDGRTTALAYASVRVFRRLGLWTAIAPEAEGILDILVTDGRRGARAPSGGRLHFDSRRLETGEALGWIVENRVLRGAIFDAIAANTRIALFAPEQVVGVDFGPAAVKARLGSGAALSAPLAIAADGRDSPLRRQAGVRVTSWRYGQTGIVAAVAHERPHRGVAYEHFLPSGPFAILPMTGRRSSLVWTEAAAAAPAFLALDDRRFLAATAERFGDFLGALRLAGPRWSYPLALHVAHRFIAPRLALIGDAAHAIHPIAGQGFNLAVKDIAALADVVAEARRLGLDFGSLGALEGYERWRRFDSAGLAFGTDAINRLFSNDLGVVRAARDFGLSAVNAVGPLRTLFMRLAGGDVGRLPPLMQPEA